MIHSNILLSSLMMYRTTIIETKKPATWRGLLINQIF